MTSFSFHFLSREDRVVLNIINQDNESISQLLFTRRVVKILGTYLRNYLEKNTKLNEAVSTEDKGDVYQFMHMSQLESNPPQWSTKKEKQDLRRNVKPMQLVTKIHVQYTDHIVRLRFYYDTKYLVGISLILAQVHSFMYSLAEMSKKADWRLEDIFEWCGRGESYSKSSHKYAN
jgi:hypothetical protein